MEPRVGGAHCRGELWVLGKRPLDLLEQPLLVLRERHGTPPRSRGRSGPDRQSVAAASRLPRRKFTRGSAGRKAGPWSGRADFRQVSRRLAHLRTILAQQAGWTDDVGAEAGGGRVGGPLGVAPAVIS